MAPTDSEIVLSPRLEAALDDLTHRGLATRLRAVYLAAARAIDRLGNLNLMKHEPTSVEQGPADLSLWEEMAPVVRDTVVEVNELLGVIRSHFEPVEAGATAPASSDGRLELEVASVFDRTAANLTTELGGVGAKLRQPSVVSDRWTLLIELQKIRSGLRNQVGDLVYLTAAAFADVEREEVVPGHDKEVTRASLLRSTAADLRRAIEGKLQKLAAATGGVEKVARSIEGDLEAFAQMPGYRHVRAQNKRELVELRDALRRAGAQPNLPRDELQIIAEPALALLDALVTQTSREALTARDRAVCAACGTKVEQAYLHLKLGALGAPRVLAEAVAAAEALYGRDAALDAYLRKARTAPPASLSEPELREELERFRERISAFPLH